MPDGQGYETRSIDALIAGTEQLQTAIVELTAIATLVLKRDRITRRLAILAVIAVLGGAVGFGITLKVAAQTYVTQQQQSQTRTRVLCPFYTVMLSSVTPARKAELTAAQTKALQVIQDGYDVLGCKDVQPVPPPH